MLIGYENSQGVILEAVLASVPGSHLYSHVSQSVVKRPVKRPAYSLSLSQPPLTPIVATYVFVLICANKITKVELFLFFRLFLLKWLTTWGQQLDSSSCWPLSKIKHKIMILYCVEVICKMLKKKPQCSSQISSFCLWLDNDTVIGLRLSTPICNPHATFYLCMWSCGWLKCHSWPQLSPMPYSYI